MRGNSIYDDLHKEINEQVLVKRSKENINPEAQRIKSRNLPVVVKNNQNLKNIFDDVLKSKV